MAKKSKTGSLANGSPDPVIPWEMGTHVIEDLSDADPELARLLRASKARGMLRDWLSKLEEAKAPEKDLEGLTSLDGVFNYLLNTVRDSFAVNQNLNRELDGLKRDHGALNTLYQREKKSKEERKKIEANFMKNLFSDVFNLFSAFEVYDEFTRKNVTGIYKNQVQRALQELSKCRTDQLGLPQREDHGYSLEDQLQGLKVTFTDPDLALAFYDKFVKLKGQQTRDFSNMYVELLTERNRLRIKLREKGLSDTLIDGEVKREQKIHGIAKFERSTFEGDCQALLDHKDLPEDPEIPEEEDKRMTVKKMARKYGPIVEDYYKVVDALEKLEVVLPGLKNLTEPRERIGYFVSRAAEINKYVASLQEEAKKNIAEVNQARERVKQAEDAVTGLEEKIKTHSRQIFQIFGALGKQLKKKGIAYEFGYEKVNGKDPIEYFGIIRAELINVGRTLADLIKREAGLKNEIKELSGYKAKAGEIATKARYYRERVKELTDPEQEDLRVALFEQIKGVRHTFLNLIEGFGVKGEFEYLNSERKLPATISYEKLIEEHYLGILDDAIALTETEFADFQKMQDSLVDVTEQKQRLAARYQCETFDELSEKVVAISRMIENTQTKKDLEKQFKKYISEFGLRKNRKFETLLDNLNILIATIKGGYVAEDYLETKTGRSFMGRIYQSKPQGSNQELKELIISHYEALKKIEQGYREIDQAEKETIETAVQLNPEKDTVQKAKSLVNTINKQMDKYAKQEAANQEITGSEEYQKAAENFSVASKTGEFLGVEISSPADLMAALQHERATYASLIEAHKKYQELKKEAAQRTAS
ncbi:hypothetical protein KY306_00965 [Candidatus Woesearchaeota archaeon]|nr:hypothetical protein [Candidatus Woesearchaeota archaeon]